MARSTAPLTTESLIEAVGRFDDGASIEQLAAATKVARRTLQRRLAELVTAGLLRATGVRKGRRYHVPDQAGVAPEQLEVSDAGGYVRSLIRRPLIARSPVGTIQLRHLDQHHAVAGRQLDHHALA